MGNLTNRLRGVTKTVKPYPFLYTLFMLPLCPLEARMSLKWAEVLGLLAFTSVPSAWLCVRLSYPLNLCNWYRAQCFVMLLPLTIPIYRVLSPDSGVFWGTCAITVTLAASLANAYFVFVKPSARG